MNDFYFSAAGKVSEFAAGEIESILSDAAPISVAEAVAAASVVLGLAFLNSDLAASRDHAPVAEALFAAAANATG